MAKKNVAPIEHPSAKTLREENEKLKQDFNNLGKELIDLKEEFEIYKEEGPECEECEECEEADFTKQIIIDKTAEEISQLWHKVYVKEEMPSQKFLLELLKRWQKDLESL